MSDAQIAEGTAGTQPAPSAEPPGEPPGLPAEGKPRSRSFRRWRRSRPFWGGLLVVLGGLEIIMVTRAPLPVMLHVGMQGAIGYLIPVIIVICGFLIIFTPDQRIWNSCVAMILGLATWLTSNLGGFVIGMLLTLVGAALAFAWGPRRRSA
jgi:hypothetical protein